MIKPIEPIALLNALNYDLDHGQVYEIKTGKTVDTSFKEILRKELEKNDKASIATERSIFIKQSV
jgi:hypothetical protein